MYENNNLMKLILFDIDGTLIAHVGTKRQIGFPRFIYAIKQVYGVVVTPNLSINCNGWVDKSITRSLVKDAVSDLEFEKKWPDMSKALRSYSEKQAKGGRQLYEKIDEAVSLARLLKKDASVRLGILTGNVERMAWWKLEHAGIMDIFSFGIFSDDVEDRLTLAKTTFEKAQKHFAIDFSPSDITIIGDTIYDVRCGKVIGANTVAVTTGVHTGMHPGSTYRQDLENELPDLLVDSLMDTKVLQFFGLS